MIVFPLYLAKDRKVETKLVALKLSKPLVGSSRTSKEGSVISSTPIEVRLRSPPEIVLRVTDPISVC